MSKMFVTPPDVAQLSDLASQEIEPSSLVEEGLFTAGGVFVLRDGSPYRGYYHLHRDGEYMAGFSHDPNDAASQNTYPTPSDTEWHVRLYKAERQTSISIVPSAQFYNNIVANAIHPLNQIINNPTGENYFLTTMTRSSMEPSYRIIAGVAFYLYTVNLTRIEGEIAPIVREAADTTIVSYFRTQYYAILDSRVQRALDSGISLSAKIAALTQSYTIVPPTFKNLLLYQEGNLYQPYDFEIINVVKRNNFLKANLEFGQQFVDSGEPQIVYTFLQTDTERQKYFGVRNVDEFNEEFVKTDFYRSVVGAKEGRFVPRENIINKNVDSPNIELSLGDANTMSSSIDLLIALVFNNNIFVFYCPVCNPRTYTYPTVDLIEASSPPRAQEPPSPINAEIDNISNLNCSYTSELSATAFFGLNVQNLIQGAVLFPGAFSVKDLNLYISDPILIQKTISDKNRFMTCDVPLGNIGEYTSAEALSLYPLNIDVANGTENAIIYYGTDISLEKNKQYRFTFQAALNDHSIEITKRLRRKTSAMLEMLFYVFNNAADALGVIDPIYRPTDVIDPVYIPTAVTRTTFQLSFLIDLILKLKTLYQNTPEKISYLDKVLKPNYALTYETAQVIRKYFEWVIEDVDNKLDSGASIGRTQITWKTFPPVQHVTSIEKEFSKVVSSYVRHDILTLPQSNIAALPLGGIEDISQTAFPNVHRNRHVTAQHVVQNEIPLMGSYNKEYIYSDVLTRTSLEKYASNYKLTACSQTFGTKYSTADLREITYNAQENPLYLEILAQYNNLRPNTHIEDNLANSALVTSPIFVPLSEYYDTTTTTYSLESGNYLIKMSDPNYSYNNYFLLVI